MNAEVVYASIRLLLILILIYAAASKVVHWVHWRTVTSSWSLPRLITTSVLFLLPAVELVLGIALLAGVAIKFVLLMCALVFLIFVIAQVIVLHRNKNAKCGCFGANEEKITFTTILRALFLAVVAYLGYLAEPNELTGSIVLGIPVACLVLITYANLKLILSNSNHSRWGGLVVEKWIRYYIKMS